MDQKKLDQQSQHWESNFSNKPEMFGLNPSLSAKKALKFAEALIGINNRNLKTLKTDINTTYDICDTLVNHRLPLISESGIKNKEELLEIKHKTKIKTFLIGESILKNLDKNDIFSVL